ncbi:TetR/AcrR family transcriptional regulator [Amycolatopsis acidiphila]|uniref:TetR/AcrR family transcriptional regulator n=1 Tax=Amycolatopsis acidiphila TaxID=715473 RepID=A0A558AMU4_9PSEU|nr:TetR/AcrR family transcriptional regulator [Amycolatopsis acidiphila]TVT25594.1 TetR/AcrR family transcriptional regulator [Amycolatopsis acidiphila]UIJ60347.1 TetR/AcrR family transcriptional regulator [Amycolatopsis acidiphila]GHG90569.1 TetR family transcriptional regulator [Amycolatopsis acidiphila]
MSGAESRTRTYRSELRQRQAAQTRRCVVESAVEVFSEHGYHGATFAQIAKRAGVSVETVQKHGPKTALLWAAVEVASFGAEGQIDFFDTDRGTAMLQLDAPDAFATFVGELVLAINVPVAGVWTAVTAAAHGDREVRGVLAERLTSIRTQVKNILRTVAERGWLRTDVPFDDLVEALCVITSVESYVRYVRMDGKSHEQYKAFVTRTVHDTILMR